MAKEEQQNPFTQEQFMEFMRMMMQENRESILAAVQEFKKPDEYTQQKLEETRKREQDERVNRMRSSIAEERKIRQQHFNCSHLKTAHGIKNPDHAFMGQVNNDGFFRPSCCRCQRVFPKLRATDEQVRNGVGLKDVPLLTAKILLSWHIKTLPDCKECNDPKGHCGRQQLKELEQGFLNPSPEVDERGKVIGTEKMTAEAVYGVTA